MRQVFADARLQQEFSSQGYVRVPWLSTSEVADVLAQFAALRPDGNFAPEATYHCSFLDTNLKYRRQTFQLIQQVFEPHIQACLVGFELLNTNFYVKPPGTGEFEIHQNWPAITDLGDTTVTIWCPLADVIESNGAIQVVAGSHKILSHVEAPNAPAYFTDFADTLIRDYLTPVSLSAGEAIIFDDSLIHWSARNDSDQARVAIQALCVPMDATPAFFCKASDSQFELIAAGSDFYLEQNARDLWSRQRHWKSLGYVVNQNRTISVGEFARLMANGDAARSAIDQPPAAGGSGRRHWFDRARSRRG